MIEDVLKGRSSCLKYWWWEKSSLLCFVIVQSKDWVTLAFAKIGRIEHVLFVTTLNTNYSTWSSSVLAKIFIIDGVAVGFTPNTAKFRWRCFQTNKPLHLSEHLVLVVVYLKILNGCKIIVKIAIWLYIRTQTILMQIIFGHNLYTI